MNISKKSLALNKYGLNGTHKKIGVNFWRFFFTGIEKSTGGEQQFFIEFEFLNSWDSPDEPSLGYKSRVNVTSEDLQYALTGNTNAETLRGEKMVIPSYAVVRIGKLGRNPKQLCSYMAPNQIKFSQKPFEIDACNKYFSDSKLHGFINLSESDINEHPEYLCESGYATWNLSYEIEKDSFEGYSNGTEKWFPVGLITKFDGTVSFDGNEYNVIPAKSMGYIDRYWNKSFPDVWFHISSCNLVSLISGKPLLNSGFSIQGIFENNVSFIGNFEDLEISFCAENAKRNYTVVWDCSQMPSSVDSAENRIHWSVSITNKMWVVDVDLYCKINELYNRSLEMPEGQRKVLNKLQSGTANGEIKLYKKNKTTLEQIEYARINTSLCEFGHKEDSIS